MCNYLDVVYVHTIYVCNSCIHISVILKVCKRTKYLCRYTHDINHNIHTSYQVQQTCSPIHQLEVKVCLYSFLPIQQVLTQSACLLPLVLQTVWFVLLHCEVGHTLEDSGFGGNVVDFEGSAWTPLQRQVELQQHLDVTLPSVITS